MHVFITGNPIDGLQFIGPFETKPEAYRHHYKLQTCNSNWWIADLKKPEENLNEVVALSTTSNKQEKETWIKTSWKVQVCHLKWIEYGHRDSAIEAEALLNRVKKEYNKKVKIRLVKIVESLAIETVGNRDDKS